MTLSVCRGGDSRTKRDEIHFFGLGKMHCNTAPLPGKAEQLEGRRKRKTMTMKMRN